MSLQYKFVHHSHPTSLAPPNLWLSPSRNVVVEVTCDRLRLCKKKRKRKKKLSVQRRAETLLGDLNTKHQADFLWRCWEEAVRIFFCVSLCNFIATTVKQRCPSLRSSSKMSSMTETQMTPSQWVSDLIKVTEEELLLDVHVIFPQ